MRAGLKRLQKLILQRKRVEPVYIPTLQSELLQGRRALITGGGSGIGLAMAEAFRHSGAAVVLAGRDEARLKKAQAALGGEGVEILPLDISDVQGMQAAVTAFLQETGPVDILVNNAGRNSFSPLGKVTEAEFDAVVDTNLKGSYFLSQLVAEDMKARHLQGNILMVGSSSSFNPASRPYGLSKWGLRGMTLGLAKALIPHRIVVNGIAPGPTATDMLGVDTADLTHAGSPAGRYITPEEIANLAVVLVSGLGRMVVGDMLCATGGAGVVTFDYQG